jgi:hypothetical protein
MALNLQVENVVSTTAQSVKDQNGNTSALTFSTDNVGIGTTNPSARLHIHSRDNEALRITNSTLSMNVRMGVDSTGVFIEPEEDNSSIRLNATPTRVGLYVRGTDGNVGIGTRNPRELLEVSGNILVTGDISLANADCAEEFDICATEQIEPGTVMVLGEEGKLEQSQKAYDKRVVGVVSGAGNYKPGIVLNKQESGHTRKPIALLGKVFCRVDAQYGAIDVGDLLTTSPTPGHAMKADDPAQAFGAVIGKALRPVSEGYGLIPILIALQ